jgi:solute carrier family 25 carnitine/acylcarnitine transporter 20/29
MRMQTYSTYTSTLDVARKMIEADGFKSLYRGLPSPALGFGLTFAVSFSSYGYCCRQLSIFHGVDASKLSYNDLIIAGAITGAVQSPFRTIVDRVKSVMQVHESRPGKTPYSWSGTCASDLVRKYGINRGLFLGFNSVLLREVPQFAIYYPSYEYLKITLGGSGLNPFVTQLLAGGVAGTVQWLPPFYCADVIKSRMQTAPIGYYNVIWDCTKRLYAEHGMHVFFRGLSPALMRAFPLHSIIFATYEYTMKLYQQHLSA